MPSTNYPDGITNVAVSTPLGSFVQPDPSRVQLYFNDFNDYLASDWTVVETQAGATQALVAGPGGLLALTNSAALNDINGILLAAATYQLAANKRFWMKARYKVDNATNATLLFGLVDTLVAFNPANGVYIQKPATFTSGGLSLEKAGVATASGALAAAMVNDTYTEAAITFEPGVGVSGWMGGSRFATIPNLTNLPIVNLAPAIAVQNGTAAAITLTVDYLLVAVER